MPFYCYPFWHQLNSNPTSTPLCDRSNGALFSTDEIALGEPWHCVLHGTVQRCPFAWMCCTVPQQPGDSGPVFKSQYDPEQAQPMPWEQDGEKFSDLD